MELRHLNYFAAVAQTLNFRRAAEQLHITRPALSMQIRDLEQELGVQLLERTTARVQLTEPGKIYLREVKRILTQVEQANEMAREAAKLQLRRISIGGIGPLTPIFLPSVLRSFNKKFPKVEVSIIDLMHDRELKAVKEGDVQIGFAVITDEAAPGFNGLSWEPIRHFKLLISLSRYHPLAHRKSIYLKELLNETFITFDKPKSHLQKIRSIFQEAGLPCPRFRHVQSFDGLTSLVAAEQGVSFTLEGLEPSPNNVTVALPLKGFKEPPSVTLIALWKKGNDSELVHNLINILKQAN